MDARAGTWYKIKSSEEQRMSETNVPAIKPARKGLLIAGCLTPIVLIAVVIGLFIFNISQRAQVQVELPEGMEFGDDMKFNAWASPTVSYDGAGRLDAYVPFGCRRGIFAADPSRGLTIGGPSTQCRPAMNSALLKGGRTVLVHVPEGYDPNAAPYPLIIAFHGFGQRPHHVARILMPAFDKAQATGKMPKVVLVMPDMSLSGNGLDNTATPWDEISGSWGVNSNHGRFADHLTKELLPWIIENYNVRIDGASTVVLGGSMGGTIALNMMLDDPARFPNVGAFYPGIDLRYSCNGDRTADYNPDCYRPLTDDNPNRAMVTGHDQARFFTERTVLYPVFDSDKIKGEVWTEDLPVWQRVRERNVVDRLRDNKPDLTGVHVWYIVGMNDDFNIDAQSTVFNELIQAAGATLAPLDQLRPGRHDIPFIHNNIDDAITWINERLSKAQQ